MKARLGLQRPATPAPQAAPATPAPPADARRDPFAAPARPAAPVMQQPEVITDAGPPVHVPEAKKRNAGTWIKLAAIVLLPSAFFFFYGGVYNARKLHNKTIEDAQQIKDEVTQLRKTTQLIVDALTTSFQRAKLNPDMKLIEELGGLELVSPKTDKIFRTNYAYLESLTIERLFGYYNDTILLYAAVQHFARTADRMKEELEKAVAKASEVAQTNYGIVIDGNSGPFPIGNLVMLGAPICADKQPQCAPDEWVGLQVKASPTSSWTPKMLAGEDYQRVLPLAPDKPLAQQALIGSAETAALTKYQELLNDVRAITKRVMDAEKDLLKELGEEASKPKVFVL